jgi:hypothetical protein
MGCGDLEPLPALVHELTDPGDRLTEELHRNSGSRPLRADCYTRRLLNAQLEIH